MEFYFSQKYKSACEVQSNDSTFSSRMYEIYIPFFKLIIMTHITTKRIFQYDYEIQHVFCECYPSKDITAFCRHRFSLQTAVTHGDTHAHGRPLGAVAESCCRYVTIA